MTAPVFVDHQESVWNTDTVTKAVSIVVQTGDIIVMGCSAADSSATFGAPSNDGAALTWTEKNNLGGASNTTVMQWTASADSNRTIAITCNRNTGTGVHWGMYARAWRTSDGVGAVGSVAGDTTANFSANITTTQANSAIDSCQGDWNAVNSARTALTGAGAWTEKTNVNDAGGYNAVTGYHADAGAIGTYAVGSSAPSGQDLSIGLIEIKGSAAAASAAITGTATAGIVQADVVAGGKTIVTTLTGDTFVVDTITPPLIEAADCTVSGNNTAEDPWAVSHPNAATGDLLIFYVSWDDSTTTTSVTAPSGPNGETLTAINATPVTDSSTETRAQAWRTVATGAWTAGTISFNPNAIESWSATCIRVPAGEFDATTPIGASATTAATTTTDTTVDSPAFSAGATDGDGRLVVCHGIDVDPLGSAPTGWTNRQTQDLGAVAHGVATRDAAVTDSESIASAAWTIAGDSWTSIAFVVRAPTATPFASARQAFINGFDSAQSEAAGWDAEVKAKAAVTEVVRTSDTVVTWTVAAQAGYSITAQEVITGTIPASILAGGTPIVATPTFTIDVAAGGGGGGGGGPTIQNQLKRSYRPRPFAPGNAR